MRPSAKTAWIARFLSCAFLAAAPCAGLRADEPETPAASAAAPAAPAAVRTFQTPSGVRVEVTPGQYGPLDRQVLTALEEAAVQAREQLSHPTVADLAGGLPCSAPSTPHPQPAPEPDCAAPAEPDCSDGACLLDLQCVGLGSYEATVLPQNLLWEPPLANNREPRMYAKPTTLSGPTTNKTFDGAIGGEGGIFRLQPTSDPDEAFQFDLFAAAFTRIAGYNTFTAVDYHVGTPLTFADGPWQVKLAYEHTSTHLGDDYVTKTGLKKIGHIRDEIVAGLAYCFWEGGRVYGQFGYAAITFNTPGPHRPDRYDMGVEWNRRRPTGFGGEPYAAVDLQLFGDENYTPDLAAQLGWQWIGPAPRMSAFRIALDAYTGRSPFGQFFQERDRWVGVTFSYEF